MGKIHKRYSPSLKVKLALEAIREEETVAELASRYMSFYNWERPHQWGPP